MSKTHMKISRDLETEEFFADIVTFLNENTNIRSFLTMQDKHFQR